MICQTASPFKLLFWWAGTHGDLEQLMVALEDQLPWEWRRVTLETCHWVSSIPYRASLALKSGSKGNLIRRQLPTRQTLPLPLSTSSMLSSHSPMQAWTVYIWSPLVAEARMRKSRYKRQIRYCPSTPSRVCHEIWSTPHKWIWPSARTEFFDRASGYTTVRKLLFMIAWVHMVHTMLGKTKRSCNSQDFSIAIFIRGSSVARLISFVASRSLMRTFSISIWESGQSHTGVCLSSSANRSGYLQTLWIGYLRMSESGPVWVIKLYLPWPTNRQLWGLSLKCHVGCW
jgi:hypothetical protein